MLTDYLKVPAPPKDPARVRFDQEIAKNAKPKRPRDKAKKSRRNQRQSMIGQAIAATIGGEQGPKAKSRARSSISGSLGGLSSLGF